MSGFHEGGDRAYIAALVADHEARLRLLNAQLESAPRAAAAQPLKDQIAEQHKLHRDALRNARGCLF